MTYQQSPLHIFFNLYQVVDTLMETRTDSPDLTVYDFTEWRALEPYRAYLNSPSGRESLATWQAIFQSGWQTLKVNCVIFSQDRCVTSYKLDRYIMSGWQVTELRYSYNSADIQSETASLRTMLNSLVKKMAHKAQQSVEAS